MLDWLRNWVARIRQRREARRLAVQALEMRRAKARLAA